MIAINDRNHSLADITFKHAHWCRQRHGRRRPGRGWQGEANEPGAQHARAAFARLSNFSFSTRSKNVFALEANGARGSVRACARVCVRARSCVCACACAQACNSLLVVCVCVCARARARACACAQACNSLLVRRERWIALFLCHGAVFLALAAALAPFDHTAPRHPSTYFLQFGTFLSAVAAALELGRRRAARCSLHLIAVDWAHYDAAWARLRASFPTELAAFTAAARRLQHAAAAAADEGSGGGGELRQRVLLRPPAQPARQLQRRMSENLARLAAVPRPFRDLLADVNRLYAQEPNIRRLFAFLV
jgi:hypothetical protein